MEPGFFDYYLAIVMFIGVWSYMNGWSFWWAFFVALILTPVMGLVFVLIRGKGPKYPR